MTTPDARRQSVGRVADPPPPPQRRRCAARPLSRQTTARREPCAVAVAAAPAAATVAVSVTADRNTAANARSTIATVLPATSRTPVTGKGARMMSSWIYVTLCWTVMMSLVNGKSRCRKTLPPTGFAMKLSRHLPQSLQLAVNTIVVVATFLGPSSALLAFDCFTKRFCHSRTFFVFYLFIFSREISMILLSLVCWYVCSSS